MIHNTYKLFLIFLFASHFSMAQHPVYIDMNQKEEMPDIEFYDIIEDKKGFIWLAANNGLFRYDGKEFKNYSHPKKRGLSVFGLQFDDKDRLWCNNISGQYFFIENDSLKFYTDLKKYTKGQLGVYFFQKNKIIVHTFNKFLEVDIQTKKITDNASIESNIPFAFKRKDTLFFLEQNSLKYRTDEGKINVKSKLDITYSNSVSNKIFVLDDYLLHQSFDNLNSSATFYFGRDSLSLISNKDLQHNQLITHALKDENKLWFCSKEAVYVYQYHQGTFLLKDTFFQGKGVTKMLKDSKGNYWFITSSNGVYVIPNIHLKKFNLFNEKNITALEKINDSTLIFGTNTGEINVVYTNSSSVIPVDNPYFEKVNALAYNGLDDIYVSLSSKSFALSAKKFTRKSNAITKNHNFRDAKDISVIDTTKFIYSAFAFADIFDKENVSPIRLGHRRSYSNHYSSVTNEIYVGYVDGLEYYKEDLKPHEIKFKEQSIFAIDIDETTDKMVWVSTFNDGVLGVKNGEIVYNYNENNGLLSNQTRIVKADGIHLWIVTNKGLQRFNTQTKTFQNLTKKDGISTFVISDITVFKSSIVLGSNKGLYLLDKEEIFKPTKKLPDFYFTNVLVEDQVVAIKTNYDLSSSVNKIQFQFHTNGYFSEENTEYQYRLLGKTDSWTAVSEGVNEVVFNSLSAGNYTFQLKSIDKTSVEETAIKSIQIKINLPFFKQWWFIISSFLILLVSIAYYYSRRIRTLNIKQEETLEKERITKQLISSELESLRSQMNPHFIFNALNSIQEYIILNEKNLASAYLVKFSRLIRMYLEHSQEQYISLAKEIKALELYLELEKDRFEDSLEYQLLVAKDINTAQIQIPSIFIQPYVENAIKHGLLHKTSDRKLNISFELAKKDELICTIQDNGIGRVASEDIKKQQRIYHKSYATKANAKRIDLINLTRTKKITISVEDLYTKEQESTGTLIHINIPYESTDN